MPNASVITSLGSGVCSIDGPSMGMIITGSPNTNISGMKSARNTDIVLSFCGHIGMLVIDSPRVYVNGLQKSRISSVFTGTFTGNVVTGVSNVVII